MSEVDTAAATAEAMPQGKPGVGIVHRFGLAVLKVLASNSYPLAGHVRDELHKSVAALGDTPEGFSADVESAKDALSDHLNDAAEAHTKALAAAVEAAKADLKAATDAALKAISDAAAKAAPTPAAK
jgi:hypothetical protein